MRSRRMRWRTPCGCAFRDEESSSWPGLSRPSTASLPHDVDARHEAGHDGSKEVVLFVDTFHRYFERETIDAARAVLTAGGYRVHLAKPSLGDRPLCCGRTFLAIGRVDQARREAERVLT